MLSLSYYSFYFSAKHFSNKNIYFWGDKIMNLSNFLENASKETRKRYNEANLNIEEVMQNIYNELSEKCTATMHDNKRITITVLEGKNINKLFDIVLSSISTHISPEFAVFALKIVCRNDAVEILKRED